MRIVTVALLAMLSASIAEAQDQTLLGDSATKGGFGGPVLKLTRIAGMDAVLVGGRGGLILNGTGMPAEPRVSSVSPRGPLATRRHEPQRDVGAPGTAHDRSPE